MHAVAGLSAVSSRARGWWLLVASSPRWSSALWNLVVVVILVVMANVDIFALLLACIVSAIVISFFLILLAIAGIFVPVSFFLLA